MPRPFTITRTGYRPGAVALTFDDGPDPRWTPRILDILKAKASSGDLLHRRRECADPARSIAARDRRRRRGRKPHLYPPQSGDHRPHPDTVRAQCHPATVRGVHRTHPEAIPRALLRRRRADDRRRSWCRCMEAQNRGYLSVGLHVDSEDWQRPGVAAIVRNVGRGRHQERPLRRSLGNAVQPQHHPDARRGGDRSQTIAALPIIIDQLRARGLPVRAGVGACRAFDPAGDAAAVAAAIIWPRAVDLAVFDLLGFIIRALGFLFAVAIALGVARAVALAGSGCWQRQGNGGASGRRSIRRPSSAC